MSQVWATCIYSTCQGHAREKSHKIFPPLTQFQIRGYSVHENFRPRPHFIQTTPIYSDEEISKIYFVAFFYSFRVKRGSTRTQPRLCGFSPFLFLSSREHREPTTPQIRWICFVLIKLLRRIFDFWAFHASPIFPISSCCFFVPLRDVKHGLLFFGK